MASWSSSSLSTGADATSRSLDLLSWPHRQTCCRLPESCFARVGKPCIMQIPEIGSLVQSDIDVLMWFTSVCVWRCFLSLVHSFQDFYRDKYKENIVGSKILKSCFRCWCGSMALIVSEHNPPMQVLRTEQKKYASLDCLDSRKGLAPISAQRKGVC